MQLTFCTGAGADQLTNKKPPATEKPAAPASKDSAQDPRPLLVAPHLPPHRPQQQHHRQPDGGGRQQVWKRRLAEVLYLIPVPIPHPSRPKTSFETVGNQVGLSVDRVPTWSGGDDQRLENVCYCKAFPPGAYSCCPKFKTN